MKKQTIVRDELNVKGGGLYAYMPFERLDSYHKAVFKIGMAADFNKRTEQYHTYFPLGVYMVAFLENPPVPRNTRRNQNETPTKAHYLKIEKFVLNYLDKHNAKMIHSTTRVKNPNVDKEGQTEWVYTNETLIHEAFTAAKKQFGGKLKLFYLEGLDPVTNKFTSINDIAKANEQSKPNYTGKIIFHT